MRKIKEDFEIGGIEIQTRVYQPKVTVKNDIFPTLDELMNCVTCRYGRKLPGETLAGEDYHRHCTLGVGKGHHHIGLKVHHNDCMQFERKGKREVNGMYHDERGF